MLTKSSDFLPTFVVILLCFNSQGRPCNFIYLMKYEQKCLIISGEGYLVTDTRILCQCWCPRWQILPSSTLSFKCLLITWWSVVHCRYDVGWRSSTLITEACSLIWSHWSLPWNGMYRFLSLGPDWNNHLNSTPKDSKFHLFRSNSKGMNSKCLWPVPQESLFSLVIYWETISQS